jgi:metal-responsive CopG/Arc/MetJ family transcriptional regulator
MAEAEKKYLNMFFDRQIVDAIDEFRFKNRFPNRTETIRWLIDYALKQKPKPSSHGFAGD